MHGGCSTGPRTVEGFARIAKARTIHGRYSAEMMEFRRELADEMRFTRELVKRIRV